MTPPKMTFPPQAQTIFGSKKAVSIFVKDFRERNIHMQSKYKVISDSPKNHFPNTKETIQPAKQKKRLDVHEMTQQDTSKTHFQTLTKFVHRPTPNTTPNTQETPIPATPKSQIRQYYSFIFGYEKKMDIVATAQKTGFWLHFWHPRRRSRSQGWGLSDVSI